MSRGSLRSPFLCCDVLPFSRIPLETTHDACTLGNRRCFSRSDLPPPKGGPGVKPTVLIVTTSRWIPTARLGMALAEAGCVVDAACPAGHPLGKIRGVRNTYHYRGLRALHSFAAAIASSRPDFIVPGDDLATSHLHRLYHLQLGRGSAGHATCELIERSLGAAENFPTVFGRSLFIESARQLGIRAPRTEEIADLAGLRDWISRVGLPTVLKANGTSGGDGVKVVYTLEEAEKAFRALQAPP